MNSHLRKRIAMVLVFSLAVSLSWNDFGHAASKPKLSTQKVTFYELGKTKTVKVTGVKKGNIKKLSIKSSNMQAVTSVTSGKASFLVVASGYGKSTIKVKLSLKKAINKKKSYSWNLPVSVIKQEDDPTQNPVNTPTVTPINSPSASPTVSPTSTPTQTPSPTATPTTKPEAQTYTFSGTGRKVISDIVLPKVQYYVEYTYSGDDSFSPSFYYGATGDDYDRICIESYNCSGQTYLENTYEYGKGTVNGTLDVETDSGNWTFKFIPVSGTTDTSISGTKPTVSGLFTATKNRYICTYSYKGDDSFSPKIQEFGSDNYERICIESYSANGEAVMNLEKGKQYFFCVEGGNGNWSIQLK